MRRSYRKLPRVSAGHVWEIAKRRTREGACGQRTRISASMLHPPGMTDNDIPPLRRSDDMPPIHSQADLWRHWRALMGPLGFSERLLWLVFLTPDGHPTPILPTINELPVLPDRKFLEGVMVICQRICAELGGGSVAGLMSRPGRSGITAAERRWARRLTEAAATAGVAMWPMHFANDRELVIAAPDDLVEAVPH